MPTRRRRLLCAVVAVLSVFVATPCAGRAPSLTSKRRVLVSDSAQQKCIDLSALAFMVSVSACRAMVPHRFAEVGGDPADYAHAVTWYSVAQVISGYLMGLSADCFGPKYVLVAACSGTSAALVATALASSPTRLIRARALSGAFAGLIGVARMAAVEHCAIEARADTMAQLVGASSAGMCLGPLLAATLGASGDIVLALGAGAGLNAIAALVIAAALVPVPRQLPMTPRRARGWRRRTPAAAHPDTTKQPLLLPLLSCCSFLASVACTAGFATYPLLAARRYGIGPRGLGLLHACTSALCAACVHPLLAALVPRLGLRRTARGALVALGGAMFLIALSPTRTAHLVGFVVHALAYQLADGAEGSIVSVRCRLDEQGRAQGIMQSAQALGRVVSPLMCSTLFKRSIATANGGVLANGNLPFVFVGALALVAALLVPRC